MRSTEYTGNTSVLSTKVQFLNRVLNWDSERRWKSDLSLQVTKTGKNTVSNKFIFFYHKTTGVSDTPQMFHLYSMS